MEWSDHGIVLSARKHARDIRRKIDDLERMDRALRQLAEQCEDGAAAACPVIEALFAAEEDAAAKVRNGP